MTQARLLGFVEADRLVAVLGGRGLHAAPEGLVRLLRYRDQAGDDLAEIIDLCALHPDYRREVVRLLAEIDAGG